MHPADAIAVLEHAADRAFHVHVDALMHAAVLQRADHLQARAVADVRQPRIRVPAEIPLQDLAVLRAVEDGPPFFQLADALRAPPGRGAAPSATG